MASFTANRWDNNETMTDYIFLASKITADDDCRDEIDTWSLEEKI